VLQITVKVLKTKITQLAMEETEHFLSLCNSIV